MSGVSIVICTYNGAARIRWVCHAILNQIVSIDHPFEVILVDNNSSDNVAEIFLSELDCLDSKVVVEKTQGLMHARKTGVKAAKYDIISFIDDDNYIAPDWVVRVLDIFKDSSIGALGGRSSLTTDSPSVPEWLVDVQKALAIGDQGTGGKPLEIVKKLYGAGLSIRRRIMTFLYDYGYESLLEGRKGERLLSGEDTEICELVKLSGFKCCYTPLLTLYHLIPSRRLEKVYFHNLYESFGVAFVGLLPLRAMTDYKLIPGFMIRSKVFVTLILNLRLITLYGCSIVSNNNFHILCQISMYKSALQQLNKTSDYSEYISSRRNLQTELKHLTAF